MKKIIKSAVFLTLIVFLLSPICFGSDVDFKEQIKHEDGSLFEKIIAECIGGIAQTIFDFATGSTLNVGFKDYNSLIFNNNQANDALSPFNTELWNKTMDWYRVFAIISGSLILISVIILSYKITIIGTNTARKNEAKDSLMRLCFGGVAISLAPLFIRLLLFMNNSLIHILITAANSGNLDAQLGNSMLTSIRTGNAITTALVIAMFIYLFVKLNIKFIVRQFTIIIFTIFTPIACGLWIINKNVTAASIWAGQIIMNIFMQFVYCFLFLIYLAFLPSGGGWAVSLIWDMMIIPLADTLMNCLQNLTSRIAGIDNEQVATRAMGMGTMLGYGIGAIKEQFNNPSSNAINTTNDNTDNSFNGGIKNFVSKAKEFISPSMNLTAEKDYNENVNPIRNVIPTETTKVSNTENKNTTNATRMYNEDNKSYTNSQNETKKESIAKKVIKTSYNVGKAYLDIGAKMADGNFQKTTYKPSTDNRKTNFQNTAYTQYENKKVDNYNLKKLGDENETKKQS